MTALDSVPRYRVDRPFASLMVPERADCMTKCSVVNAVSAIWRVTGSVGASMPLAPGRWGDRSRVPPRGRRGQGVRARLPTPAADRVPLPRQTSRVTSALSHLECSRDGSRHDADVVQG